MQLFLLLFSRAAMISLFTNHSSHAWQSVNIVSVISSICWFQPLKCNRFTVGIFMIFNSKSLGFDCWLDKKNSEKFCWTFFYNLTFHRLHNMPQIVCTYFTDILISALVMISWKDHFSNFSQLFSHFKMTSLKKPLISKTDINLSKLNSCWPLKTLTMICLLCIVKPHFAYTQTHTTHTQPRSVLPDCCAHQHSLSECNHRQPEGLTHCL